MGSICKCKPDYTPTTLEEIGDKVADIEYELARVANTLEVIHSDAVLRKQVERVIKEKGLTNHTLLQDTMDKHNILNKLEDCNKLLIKHESEQSTRCYDYTHMLKSLITIISHDCYWNQGEITSKQLKEGTVTTVSYPKKSLEDWINLFHKECRKKEVSGW